MESRKERAIRELRSRVCVSNDASLINIAWFLLHIEYGWEEIERGKEEIVPGIRSSLLEIDEMGF